VPPAEFEQPASRIGGGGRRVRLGLVVWGAGLVAIVGIAVLGRPEATPDANRATLPSPTAPPAAADPALHDILVLSDPPEQPVTTVRVTVRGLAHDVVTQIELVLLRSEAQIARQTVVPRSLGRFTGVFTVGAPRDAGPVQILAIGRDRHGIPVVTVRQRVLLGALFVVTSRPAPGPSMRPPKGEDGLMGSLTLDPVPPAPSESEVAIQWVWPIGQLGWRTNPAQL